jgi:hypothetical protein
MIGITEVTMSNSMSVKPFSSRPERRRTRVILERPPSRSCDLDALRETLLCMMLSLSPFIV